MEYGAVYLESSIVDLKPNVLNFLTKLVDKAKEIKDVAIAFKKKELADLGGKDTRTITRYLNELENKQFIQMKGVRGRAGGTIILLNTDRIRFDTSDKALINSDEPISIDDIVEKKLPKKKKPESNKDKRPRRTKLQMLEAKLLKGEQQSKNDQMNDELKELGGVPNWEWFQKTDNPVGNYRTYLLSRLYNRYAVLFTDYKNAEVETYGEGSAVQHITNDYDVLSEDFYGSSRWVQFEKFRAFCEENDIDPALYLSAQFSRSVFTASAKNMKKKALPFVNALIGDTSYEVFKQYCDYQKMVSYSYAAYKEIPVKFADDFVVRAIVEAYETANSGVGLLQYRHAISDFLNGEVLTDKEIALVDFYTLTEQELRKRKVSYKTRDTIKKFVLLQSMILTSGATALPNYLILGSEHTQVVLKSIESMANSTHEAYELRKRALGVFIDPQGSKETQLQEGARYNHQIQVLDETRQVLKLIMERKGLHMSLADLNEAFREYGKELIPLDDFSVMDTDKIVELFEKSEEVEINHDDITTKSSYELVGELASDDALEQAIAEFMGSE
ncbi:DNA-binding protein [Bacillus phage Mater]|uniref:DNA-binding protein n=1 Tax=Bacillus phage Mater TaxID=1540090 RepID=A0A0A0RML1_9CAUD|nr:HTH DNA binding protein [Bacillus phage Mater]AIW03300.1 DNA-binding protein [Bacillus phage Mater]